MEGYPKRKRGDPTWSAARDDAYAQKERLGGEPYRLCTLHNLRNAEGEMKPGIVCVGNPSGSLRSPPPFTQGRLWDGAASAGANEALTTIYFFFIISESPGQNIPIE